MRMKDNTTRSGLTLPLAYLASLAVFATLDAVWLITAGAALYRPLLDDLLAPTVRLGPAIAFYLAFPVGIVAFAILPALRAGSARVALASGALFGALAYGTYDLTNHAIMQVWSLHITVIDIAAGASAAAALAAYVPLRALSARQNARRP